MASDTREPRPGERHQPQLPSRPSLPARLEGSCHCGAVRYRVTARSWTVRDCNCSVCAKKGTLHLIVPQEEFELLSGEAALRTYRFNTRVARHTFCGVCGVQPFYTPRSHPDGVSVNARTLDAVPLGWLEIEPFDGQNWEDNVATIQRR